MHTTSQHTAAKGVCHAVVADFVCSIPIVARCSVVRDGHFPWCSKLVPTLRAVSINSKPLLVPCMLHRGRGSVQV